MDKVKEVAESLKNDLKPFVIVATTEDLPVKFYLSVYDALFEFDTFLGALDVLFQTFFVLNIPYPTQLNSFYVFMQKFFYKIKLEGDPILDRITKMIKLLDFTRL
ncbi:hypothetical protein ACFFRR_004167 [Megaselia abdita]